jgi:hypothetical protein
LGLSLPAVYLKPISKKEDLMPVVSQLSIYFIRYGGAGGRGDAVSPDLTGRATIAAVPVSIEFKAQLLLVDSLLPTFLCFISCSVFVSDSSPSISKC